MGNQMFQQAFLIALRQMSSGEIKIDLSEYERRSQHNGYELERVFGIKNDVATREEIAKYTLILDNKLLYKIYSKLSFLNSTDIKEIHSYKYYPDILKRAREGYYDGYWQCHRYFDDYRELVRRTFTFAQPLDSRNAELAEEILNHPRSVSIHVRRGDYLKHRIYKGLCGVDYYRRAIEYVQETLGTETSFYIFSDDMAWCKDNIVDMLGDSRYTLVDWNTSDNSYRDMQLMTMCRVNIIANSSFSWWAAYINQRDGHLVVAPKRWVNQPLEYSMQLEEWNAIL